MLKSELEKLNDTIKNCRYYNEENPPCRIDKKTPIKIKHPIVHVPLRNTQKILIISQAPSRDTDSNKVDRDEEIPSKFRCRIYSLIFFGCDKKEYVKLIENKENYRKSPGSFCF